MKLKVAINNGSELEIEELDEGLKINGKTQKYELSKKNDGDYILIKDQRVYNISLLSHDENELKMKINGTEISLNVKDHIAQILEDLGMDVTNDDVVNEITAPMPGAIIGVNVTEGQEVQAGEALLILEAMKMENIIKSPVNGVIEKIHVIKGQNVEKNHVLISF